MIAVEELPALSKLVSYALRHRPGEFELELDAQGWVPVDQLVDALRTRPGWEALDIADLQSMVALGSRQRHELSGGRIRARYGHSVPRRIEHDPQPEPGIVFHGTARRALPGILDDGLLPGDRQYVHLARTPELAEQIGRRRDAKPVVLEIDAKAAADAGITFHRSGEMVLCTHVPPVFIAVRGCPATDDPPARAESWRLRWPDGAGRRRDTGV